MTKSRFTVTDHALVRFVEQVLKMDLKPLRDHIARKVELAEEHDGCSGILIDGQRYVLHAGKIITIKPAHQPKHLGRRRK